ncbi:MAG TPA: M15 family metallopeptidase [bacterium]|nr:M15 family metallopeptidase [bacterium]
MKKNKTELLVDLKKYCPGIKIHLDGKRLQREKIAYLRLEVAKRLRQAQKLLPKGWNFVLRDAWRPAYMQCRIYYNFLEKARAKYPQATEAELQKRIAKYVASWYGEKASGHLTGGALDLRLIDQNGRRVPMISRKLSYEENARPLQLKLAAHIQKNRKIMADALRAAGFYNNKNEYWHWSYGDYYWARAHGRRAALYSVVPDPLKIYDNEDCPCGSGKKFACCCGILA